MQLSEILLTIALIGIVANIIFTLTKKVTIDTEQIVNEISSRLSAQSAAQNEALQNTLRSEQSQTRQEITLNMNDSLKTISGTLLTAQQYSFSQQNEHIAAFTETLAKGQEQQKSELNGSIEAFKANMVDSVEALTQSTAKSIEELKAALSESFTALQNSVAQTTAMLSEAQNRQFEMQDKRLAEMTKTLNEKQEALTQSIAQSLSGIDARFKEFSEQNAASLEAIRHSVKESLDQVRTDNQTQLDKMRETVDQKLQKTLDERITQSFQLVNERLAEVYSGLGEMKTLASGVGDLKKVLSNVKTRGIMGEIQLGAIISELLSPEQYAENIATVPNSANRVEYAIKLPGDGEQNVYLPIDAKFPLDTYSALVDAYELGDADKIKLAQLGLETRIRGCAKDIHEKYIEPPYTTDFAIMFLPIEGLYADVVRLGLVETLQRDYKVNIAGPTTFAALLNSLQMGFKTLAIQKRSSEVWNVLGAVKTEFSKFSDILANVQKRLDQTGSELTKLIGTRTNVINRRLREVSELPTSEAAAVLKIAEAEPAEEEEI